MGTYGFPIDIRRVTPGGSSSTSHVPSLPWNTFKVHGKAVPLASEFQYGDGMEVRFMNDPDRFAKKFKDYRKGRDLLFKDTDAGDSKGIDRAHVVVPIHLCARTSIEPQSKLELFLIS